MSLNKVNSRCFELLKRAYSISFNSSNVGNFFWSWKDCHQSLLSCVQVLHETWNKAFSRRTRAVTAMKCSNKARSTCRLVLPIQTYHIPFCRSRWRRRRRCSIKIGTLSNYDDEDNNGVKNQLVLWPKQQLCTCIAFFSTFLWRPRRDYDVKPPNATFCGGRGHKTTNFPFSIST